MLGRERRTPEHQSERDTINMFWIPSHAEVATALFEDTLMLVGVGDTNRVGGRTLGEEGSGFLQHQRYVVTLAVPVWPERYSILRIATIHRLKPLRLKLLNHKPSRKTEFT